MKINFCGGASEVGASCILVNIDNKNILLDCGIRPKGGKDQLPDFSQIQKQGGVDCIIVSHAHLDHTGALPIISREYPDARLYMTHMTKDLIRVLLYDSLKLMNNNEGEIPIYAEKHVLDMLDRSICYSPQFTFRPFNDNDIEVTFYIAGHIAGAVMIYIKGKEGTLLYTGDISGTPQRTVAGTMVPKLRPDVVITESTYGDKLHANRQIEEDRLVDTVREVISRKGKILIPAFALGRAQEVILILKKAMNKGQLPKFKIYVDGMVKDVNRVYKQNPNYLREELMKKVLKGTDIFYDDNIVPVDNKDIRKEILDTSEPLCVISSSGMLTGGPSAEYAEKFAANEQNYIAITGYQDEEAPGRAIIEVLEDTERDRVISLNGRSVPLKCEVGKYGLSAHSDKGEILGIINKTTPKKIFLVHGDKTIIESLAKYINEEIWSQIYTPVGGESFEFFIQNPRKQINLKEDIPSLNMTEKLSLDNIERLYDYLYKNYGIEKGYLIEELFYIWNGKNEYPEEDIKAFRDILNATPYFEVNSRKLFLYHPVEEKEITEATELPLEMNAMFEYVDKIFPASTGLYKRGAKYDEKIVLLYFNFPDKAKELYKADFEEVEKSTGWRIELNANCNTLEAEAVIYSLLPENTSLTKVSYHKEQKTFVIETNKVIESFNKIQEKFYELTGNKLILKADGVSIGTAELELKDRANKLEQNKTMALIDDSFLEAKHKIYRKSLKQENGVKYIELSFITYEVGIRYIEKIKELELLTNWDIVVGKNPNQNEIIRLAKEICRKYDIALLKNPSVFTDTKFVKLVAEINNEVVTKACKEEFMEETGFELIIG
ncbi:MBL fold metallo-hydrolase [Clostridium manihotivorum]|uniref:MBL fold hydrolase n=1 Tax=Clostridium manihotivorum TaxID=2320868 RepID=A0A3R5TJ68_9CLOT|nr:MBL fold metallo-hydrolase [Clostridium manihotivorum]QAA34749.1 MBL fold hydrolase [Clostridium manihotivorum]